MRGYLGVCEGLDRSGKTTAIKGALKIMADEFPVIYSKGLKGETLAGSISKIYSTTLTLLTELLYIDNKIIKPNLKRGNSILQDRWYYSVLSHNPDNKTDRMLGNLYVPFLTEPDMLVYFSVSEEERLRRLKRSEHVEGHRTLLENPGLIKEREARLMKYYNVFQGYKTTIDTTNKSEEESAQQLYRFFKSLRTEEG